MKQYLAKKLKILEEQLFINQKSPNSINTLNLSNLLNDLFGKVSLNHSKHNEVFSPLLKTLNRFDQRASALFLSYQITQRIPLSKLFPYKEIEWIKDYSTEKEKLIENKLLRIIEKNLAKGIFADITLEALEHQDKVDLLAFIQALINKEFKNLKWDTKKSQLIILALSIYRSIAIDLKSLESFYFLCTILCSRLITSKEFQLANDVFNIILKKSFEDKMQEFGYYLKMRLCTLQQDSIQALLNANITLSILSNKTSISSKLNFLLLKDLIKILISLKLYGTSRKLYDHLLTDVSLSNYEKIGLTIECFGARLNSGDFDIELEMLDHIKETITDIEMYGPDLAIEYLNILLNLKRINYKSTAFDSAIERLTLLVGQVSQDVKTLSFGSDHLKNELIEVLVSLRNIYNTIDKEFALKYSLGIALRLFEYSVENNDLDAFLLSMAFKTDYALSEGQIVKYNLNEDKDQLKERLNNYSKYLMEKFNLTANQCCIWVGDDGDNQYYLILAQSGYSEIRRMNNCNPTNLSIWYYSAKGNMSFDDIRKIQSGQDSRIVPVFPEEQELQLKEIEKELTYAVIPEIPTKEVLLIKDMNFTFFPHNLFLDETNDELISRKHAVTNILGSEWFNKKNHAHSYDLKISAWFPIVDGDWTIISVASKLKDTVSDFNISVINERIPTGMLSSNINIILAHGAENIATFSSLNTNDEVSILELDKILGIGKLAILFVCYGGFVKYSDFGHKTDSFIKTLFEKEYESVVAPVWPLDARIPPIWLPMFLSQLKSGLSVSQATYLANQTVYASYKHPGAWTNLHLYGNPNLKFSS